MSDFEQIRSLSPFNFRCGEWADLLTTAPDPEGRDCYVVRFPDGATDFWVKDDPDNRFELRAVPRSDRRSDSAASRTRR